LLLFYNQVVGLPTSLVGAAIMVALVVDACVDPIIGQVSDHWRSRLGRRHPFMYASALPVAAFYVLLWNPPRTWSHAALTVFLVLTATLVRSFISLYEIPSAALAAELAYDYDERTSILGYRVIFGFIGGLGMTLLAYLVFLRPTPQQPVGQLNSAGYSHYGLAAGVIMFVVIVASAAGTHRRIPYLASPNPRPAASLGQNLSEMAKTLSNRSFLTMLTSGLFTAIGSGVIGALYLYLMTFFFTVSTGDLSLLLLPSFVGGLAGPATASAISRRIGKKMAAIWLESAAIVVVATPVLLRSLGAFPANGSWLLVPALFCLTAVSSPLSVAGLILMQSMMADVVEESELETGRRSEGLLFSAVSFIQKAVSGTGVMISGLMLTLLRFPQHAQPGRIDPTVLRHFGWGYLACLVICWGSAILVLTTYRISRAGHEAQLRRLARG
jgi:glycoside/pentoside/hexuronide:cation symporter, GPH family